MWNVARSLTLFAVLMPCMSHVNGLCENGNCDSKNMKNALLGNSGSHDGTYDEVAAMQLRLDASKMPETALAFDNVEETTTAPFTTTFPDEACDFQCYLNRYPDLQAVFKGNTARAERHYNAFGKKEGRQCFCPKTPKECQAWGDPHWTKSFFGGHFEVMGAGLFKLAELKTSKGFEDKYFLLQGFMVPLSYPASVFGGFAAQIGSTKVSIIGKNITVNGTLITDEYEAKGHHQGDLHQASGLWVSKDLSEFRYDGIVRHPGENKDVIFNSQYVHFRMDPGYYLNLYVSMEEHDMMKFGICGSEEDRKPLSCNESLFSESEFESLCKMAGLEDCCNPEQPDPVNSTEMCNLAGISPDVAAAKCKCLEEESEPYFKACIFDYCATGGDESMVADAFLAHGGKCELITTTTTTTNPEEACDWQCYLDRYHGLAKAVGKNNLKAAEKHWYSKGKAEGRICQCRVSLKVCHAWGDPHFTHSFFGEEFSFQGAGLFKLAATTDGYFEIQGFQVPLETGASIFGGFAAKLGDIKVSIVDRNISIDGSEIEGGYGTKFKGLWVAADQKHVRYDAPHKHLTGALTFNSQYVSFRKAPGFYLNLFIEMDGAKAAKEGLCASDVRESLSCAHSLFTLSDFDSLCAMTGLKDCCHPEPLDNPVSSPEDACERAGISYGTAESKCEALKDSDPHFKSCVLDYCATGGDDKLVKLATKSEKADDEFESDHPHHLKVKDLKDGGMV